MARGRKTHAATKTVRKSKKIVTNPFELIQKGLIILGRPLFVVLEYSLIGLLILLSIIGQTPKILANSFTGIIKQAKKRIVFKSIKRKKLKKVITKPKRDFKFNFAFLSKLFPVKTKKKTKKVKKFKFAFFAKSRKKSVKKNKFKFSFHFPKVVLPILRLPKFTFERKLGWSFYSLSFLFLFGLLSFYVLILKDLPSPESLKTRKQEVSTKIYDRNGVLLYKVFKNENRTIVDLAEIPMHVRYATLAAEDAEFYSHAGFSLRGIIRATYRNATEGKLAGGSTITQQLIKNALLSPEKTFTRKAKEIVLSVQTELTYSKDDILEMYLNEVSYGGSAYGIQEASQVYFQKNVQDLTLGEAALLAGLPKSPTKFSPFGPNPELPIARQKDVLNLMVINKFISQEQADQATSEVVKFAEKKNDIKAPHFVMYVKDQLAARYGDELVEQGGLEVYTTLDYDIQKMAEVAVKTEVDKLARLHVTNGAAIVMDPQTGEILAMVGSKDYFDIKNDGNVNVTTRPRQPGSSIKVLNYALALSTKKFTPATIIPDVPTTFNIAGSEPYTPKNYDGQFHGAVTLRSALAQSLNIPAVKVLYANGVDKMIDLGEKMGITTWKDRSRFGLSLTLGGGETKLIELSQMFATVANYGKKPELMSVNKITDYKGHTLELNSPSSQEVLDSRVAYQLIDILKDNSARAPTFGSRSALVINRHPEVAAKTGTSNQLKDNVIVGFNQNYLVAVWIGNNDGSYMSRIASGVTGAAPIWNNIMTSLLADVPSKEWPTPNGLVRVSICPLTGTLPCQGCSSKPEWFLSESTPKLACRRETIEKINEDKKKKQQGQPVGQLLPQAAATVGRN